jgi:hypothetical protein
LIERETGGTRVLQRRATLCAALSADGRRFAAGGTTTPLKFGTWNRLRRSARFAYAAGAGVALDEGGGRLAAASWEGKAILWDVDTKKEVARFVKTARAHCVALIATLA